MRDVIGHRRLLERLGAHALRGDVAHAYGISGPRSIGKRTAALRIAQTLNCDTPNAAAGGCGTCRACRLMDSGAHPDLIVVSRLDDRRDITIEQIRAMQQELSLRPLEGRRRIVIVDDAAELSEHAEVALLKTLEEPPSHAVLLMLTPTAQRLLDTIRSRMQALAFRLVPTAEIAEGLRARFGSAAEKHATAAGGRPGLAITLATDEAARTDRRRLESEFYTLMGSGLTDRFAWAAGLADDSDPRRRTRQIERRLVEWGELVRDAAVLSQGVDRAMRPDRAAESAKLAASVNARELVDAGLLMEQLRRDLDFNANARAMLELLALKMPYGAAFKVEKP